MFARPSTLLSNLEHLLAADARLFLTSLIVSENSIGNSYLRLLSRLHEVASVLTGEELSREIGKSALASERRYQRGSVAYEILKLSH
jgi:hypothetical protein